MLGATCTSDNTLTRRSHSYATLGASSVGTTAPAGCVCYVGRHAVHHLQHDDGSPPFGGLQVSWLFLFCCRSSRCYRFTCDACLPRRPLPNMRTARMRPRWLLWKYFVYFVQCLAGGCETGLKRHMLSESKEIVVEPLPRCVACQNASGWQASNGEPRVRVGPYELSRRRTLARPRARASRATHISDRGPSCGLGRGAVPTTAVFLGWHWILHQGLALTEPAFFGSRSGAYSHELTLVQTAA